MPEGLLFHIDVFASFRQNLWLQGWLLPAKPVRSLEFVLPGTNGFRLPVRSYGQTPSPDVQQILDRPDAHTVRFDELFEVILSSDQLISAGLEVSYHDGDRGWIDQLGAARGESEGLIDLRFMDMLRERKCGTILEVGARARSGVVRRDWAPAGWRYVGVDIVKDTNVDVIGDAHELSALFPPDEFDAVMSFSVLEHLLMPWKFVIELNRILKLGAVGIFTAPQCWPLHEQPWDFWRFSGKAWDALLNRATGFAIIEAVMGEPAFVVAQKCHPATNFGSLQAGYLASAVIFQKIGPTSLEWPVRLTDIITTSYPA